MDELETLRKAIILLAKNAYVHEDLNRGVNMDAALSMMMGGDIEGAVEYYEHEERPLGS